MIRIQRSIRGVTFQLFKKRLHEGQKAFVQLTVEDSFARRYSFSFALNSSRLRIMVILWSVNKDQAFGKEYKGIFSQVLSLETGTKKSSELRSDMETVSLLLISLVNQTLLKEGGKWPCTNLCINCSLKNSINEGRGKILSLLKIQWAR